MEFQWRQLRELLAVDECQGNSSGIQQDGDQFFYRLWRCLNDAGAGTADRLHGYYDALQCARAHGLLPLRLPLKEVISPEDLMRAGLRRNRDYPGEVFLDDRALQLSSEWQAVWRKDKRRLLQTPPLDTLLPTLLNDTKYTHYTSFGQQLAVRTVLTSEKNSLLFINLPTGAGKTFIIHSLMLTTPASQLTLVIVPTISLAIEQAQRAQSMLQQANADHGGEYTWHSGQTLEVREALKARIKAGEQRLLFCSPEAASSGSLLLLLFSLAKRKMIGALVVDEAHLIDQWGAEFRPEFQLLAPLVKSLVEVSKASIRTVLLSATWGQATLNTLKELFAGDNLQRIVEVNGCFLRPEPMWYVSKAYDRDDHRRQVEDAIATLPRPLILYVSTVEDAIGWHQYLRKSGYKRCGLIHGKVSPRQREKQIADWTEDNLDIMVATSAFGVGMDKNNVRAVLHAAVPENIDRLYQESGRGGRDGYASLAQLIYRDDQVSLARHLNRDNLIGAKKGFLRWQKMHQNRESESPGHFSVYLDTKHDGIKIDSRANVAWNWRTLLMLQRAGFLSLRFAAPDLEQFASDNKDDAAVEQYFNHYFSHIGVELHREGHLDELEWNGTLKELRSRELHARQKGFQVLEDWLNHLEKPLCGILESFYTLDGYAPELACGGCPGCRLQALPVYTPTLGLNAYLISGEKDERIGSDMRIYYPPARSAALLLRQWVDWISRLLVAHEIQAIRASSNVLSQLSQQLYMRVPFWCALSYDDPSTNWNELVLVLPGESLPELDPFSDIKRIIVAPETLVEKNARGRLWWESDPKARTLDQFIRSLSSGNN
ncbi:protein DpdF [Enterobacter asburiae]